MGGEEYIDGDDSPPSKGMDVLTISLIFCTMVTLLNILYLYPQMQARADCANECNAALQAMYDSCVVQNGVPPSESAWWNATWEEMDFEIPEPYPAPEYSMEEAVCMELLDNGSLVEAECP